MKEVKLKIDGIHCDNCRASIKNALSKNDEIKEVEVIDDTAIIKYEKDLNHKKIIDCINDIGFETKEEYFK